MRKAVPREASMDAAVESLFPYLRLEQTGEEGIAGLLRFATKYRNVGEVGGESHQMLILMKFPSDSGRWWW